jgi:hypothetical protein
MAKRTARTRAGEIQQASSVPQADQAADTRSMSIGPEPSEEDIRLLAYHRYLERGGNHGRHLDDWVQAEQELKRKSKS